MAIKIIDINLNGSEVAEEHAELNVLLQDGWTLIGNSSYVHEYRYGETNEFSDNAPFERYTLFKPDQAIGEIVANGSGANVFHFDNGDGTIGQMQITDTPPAEEWNITTSAIGTDTDLYTLSNGVHKLEILDRQVAHSVLDLLNEYSQQLSAARNDSIELSNDVAATDKLLAEAQAENTRLQGVINEALTLAIDVYDNSDHDANNHKKVFRLREYLERHEE